MRFVTHGGITPETASALERHGHKTHAAAELLDAPPSESAEAPGAAEPSLEPAALLAALARHQWFLLTADAALVHCMFEEKLIYPGIIVLLIDAPDAAAQSAAIDRLFERYKRLTPKRLYTVTRNRVKIRQLPGDL